MPWKPKTHDPLAGVPGKRLMANAHDPRLSAARRGYGHKWRKARAAYLLEHPLCVDCQKEGRLVAATQVDHIQPHRGDWALFWLKSNWQPLCDRHHAMKTAKEDGGFGNAKKAKTENGQGENHSGVSGTADSSDERSPVIGCFGL